MAQSEGYSPRSSAEKRAGPKSLIIKIIMTGIYLKLPEHLSDFADQPRMDGADDPSRLSEHEKALAAQIEMAVDEADLGRFASNDLVAAIRARRWRTNVA